MIYDNPSNFAGVVANGNGITEPMSEAVNMLGKMLGQAIKQHKGQDMLNMVEHLRLTCRQSRVKQDCSLMQDVKDIISQLNLAELRWLLRSFTVFFHLVNKAEQLEIARINRQRTIDSSIHAPRTESIAEAILNLRNSGCSAGQVRTLINNLNIEPTFTAHPTEVRRRSILYKQKNIADQLKILQHQKLTAMEKEKLVLDVYNNIQLMLLTSEVRTENLSVKDEVRQGLYFFHTTLWEVIPAIYEDIAEAFESCYNEKIECEPFLKFRSWIGGDRDGNPHVTPDMTRFTFAEHRKTALNLYVKDLKKLRHDLSISNRWFPAEVTRMFNTSENFSNKSDFEQDEEPFRNYITLIIRKLELVLSREDLSYTATDFLNDISKLRSFLIEVGFDHYATRGLLNRIYVRARVFGFHLAALDLRQHSEVHESAVSDLLRIGGVSDDYQSLDEKVKISLLTKELKNPRPLLPHHHTIEESTRLCLDAIASIREAAGIDKNSFGSYIISMTHNVSDLLEVLLLAKECGLWSYNHGKVKSIIDVVPLFETISDLKVARMLLKELFENEIYTQHLKARGNFQEIMLGYSDSNKDGGYWMANWALHQAQSEISSICLNYQIDFRIFHGRGGTVGRGGGRANQAIMALPETCHNGRIRFTEQGEVITFRYAVPEIGHRHLEQITNAMIVSTGKYLCNPIKKSLPDKQPGELMDEISTLSMKKYRKLVDHHDFWDWYQSVTPISYISKLKIASRPVSRARSGEIDLNSIRAIPWNFSWTQTRYNVPGWYGAGAAFEKIVNSPGQLNKLQEIYRKWPFFTAVVNNCQREMARSELSIASHYSLLANVAGRKMKDFDKDIRMDYEKMKQALLLITQQKELLDNVPVIQKSIKLRNPYTDVLNFIQIELMLRYNQAKDEEELTQLSHAILLNINGLAAAMQSTG